MNESSTSVQVPVDAQLGTRARAAARAAALGRLALTTAVVIALVTSAVALAWRELAVAEAAYAVDVPRDDASTAGNSVSRYSLRALSRDGARIEARFWVGTSREYTVVANAGDRNEQLAGVRSRFEGAPTAVGMTRIPWRLDDARSVRTEGHGAWTFSPFAEPCTALDGSKALTTSWKLCPAAATEDGDCIVAPMPRECWRGPLRLVDLYEAGADGETVWAVVERALSSHTSRMVAGVTTR